APLTTQRKCRELHCGQPTDLVLFPGRSLIRSAQAAIWPRSANWSHSRLHKLKLPGLTHEIVAKGTVTLFGSELKSRCLVDASRGYQNIVGPKGEPAIARPARPVDAGGHQRRAQAQAPRGRLDIEQPQFGSLVVVAPHEKNRSGDHAAAVCDPGLLLG